MKFRKLLATYAAAALAVSALAVTSSAATTPAPETAPAAAETAEPTAEAAASSEETGVSSEATGEAETGDTGEAAGDADINDYFDGGTVMLITEDGKGYIDVTGADITDIYGLIVNCTFDDTEVATPETWIGGGVGANSNSTSWEQHEWGKVEGAKEMVPDFENGRIVWVCDEPVFTADEKFAQLWAQCWGGTVTFDSVELVTSENREEAAAEAAAIKEAAEAQLAVDEPTASADDEKTAEAPEDVVDAADKKDSPDTGVAGVAVAAGVVALAGAAVIVSRKKK